MQKNCKLKTTIYCHMTDGHHRVYKYSFTCELNVLVQSSINASLRKITWHYETNWSTAPLKERQARSWRNNSKCLASAEMGDRLATTDMGQKLGGCAPFGSGGVGSPCNTMWPGPKPTFVQSGILIHRVVWTQQTWAKIWGWGLCPLGDGAGSATPHLTQCCPGQGLPLYQVASWSIQPFGHNKHKPKIGGRGCAAFFREGSWVAI